MSLQPHRQHDPVHRQITDLARPRSQPPVPTVTPDDIKRVTMPMVYSGGVVMLGVTLLIFSNVLAVMVMAAGAFAYHYHSKKRDALTHQHRTYEGRVLDAQIAQDIESVAPSSSQRSNPQVEAIKAITSLEMAKLDHAHDYQMRDKDHGHDETIVRLNNQNQIDLTRLSSDAQILVAKEEGFTQREVARFQALGADRDFARQKEMIELHQEHDLEKMDKEQVHQASVAEKDRSLAIDRLITEVQGKVDVLEARMQYENPSAHAESQEEMARLKGEMAQLQYVMTEVTDPIMKKQMTERLLKDRYKRRG